MEKISERIDPRAILDSVADAMYVTDAQYQIIEVNKAFSEIYGLTREEALGKTCHEVTHGQTFPCASCLLNSDPNSQQNTIAEHIHRERYVEVSLFPTTGEQGTQCVIHIVRDVTECKRADAERKRMQAEIKALQGLLPICASCKKIRDDRGRWENVETYISERFDATFTHGICPDCAKKFFPSSTSA
jgi:PAS domain S-box-containing protein